MEEAAWVGSYSRSAPASRTRSGLSEAAMRCAHAAPPSSRPCRLCHPEERFGHTIVTTIMISTPVLNRDGQGGRSPANAL
jgi:hypothetical protein